MSLCSVALQCGYELIDTAQARDWYDEEAVGAALRSYEQEENTESNKTVFVISKLDPRLNGYESALEGALMCTLAGYTHIQTDGMHVTYSLQFFDAKPR